MLVVVCYRHSLLCWGKILLPLASLDIKFCQRLLLQLLIRSCDFCALCYILFVCSLHLSTCKDWTFLVSTMKTVWASILNVLLDQLCWHFSEYFCVCVPKKSHLKSLHPFFSPHVFLNLYLVLLSQYGPTGWIWKCFFHFYSVQYSEETCSR